jgi:hypothetical protein
MNKPSSKDQVKLVRSLLIELGMGRHRYLGSWRAKYRLTIQERRGAIDMMGSAVCCTEARRGALASNAYPFRSWARSSADDRSRRANGTAARVRRNWERAQRRGRPEYSG